MIWEAACIPFAKKDGLHYIDIYMIEEDNENEGSLYTRGMGLWNACKESRDVIAAHYHLNPFRLVQTESLDSMAITRALHVIYGINSRPFIYFKLRDPHLEKGQDNDNYYFIVSFGHFNEDVRYNYHRLCIWTTSPGNLIERIQRLNLYLPMVKGPGEIELMRDWSLALPKDPLAPDNWLVLLTGKLTQRDVKIGRTLPCTLTDTSGDPFRCITGRRERRRESEGFSEILTRRASWKALRLWVSILMLGALLGTLLAILPCLLPWHKSLRYAQR